MKQSGTYKVLMDALKKAPTKLVHWRDVKEILGGKISDQAAKAAIYYLWQTEKVFRHEDKRDKQFQYAIKMKNGLVYEKNESYGTKGFGKKKVNKGIPSAREVRKLFTTTMNNLAELEDLMIQVVDLSDRMEKQMAKIKNISTEF